MSDFLQPCGLQHTRLPCPSLSPRVCSNSCSLSWWCHQTISSSVFPFSSYPQSFPASGSCPMSQLFASGSQSVGASASVNQSVQLLSRIQLFATPWNTARQASLSITNSRSLLELMSIESAMPSNHFIFCHPLLPSIFPSIRVSSDESVVCIRWSKYWSFSFSISPSNESSGLISFWSDWFNLLAVQRTLKSLL